MISKIFLEGARINLFLVSGRNARHLRIHGGLHEITSTTGDDMAQLVVDP